MKVNCKSGLIMVVALMLGGIMQAGAQTEYKTNVSIREQLVNGSVPGAQYGPKKVQSFQRTAVLNKSANKQQSLNAQIKNGTEGGLQAAPGGGGAARKFKSVQAAKVGGAQKPMASEGKQEIKQDAKQATAKTVELPTQGKEPVADKVESVKTPVLPTQGEKQSPAVKEAIRNNN